MYCLWPLQHLLLVSTTVVCYCLWPLPRLLLMCTTVVGVLFVATPMSSISVYCLWPLPYVLIVSTTLVVFVCTTLVFVHYFIACTVCGHSHIYY